MRLYRRFDGLPAEARGLSVALGNFDGVHCGHRAVIGAAASAARRLGTRPAVLTFEPHPRQVLQPDRAPGRLQTPSDKLRVLAAEAIPAVFMLRFSKALAAMPAEDFIDRVLLRGLRVAHLAIGHDFVFGRGRGGDAKLLEQAAQRHGFGLSVVEPRSLGDTVFSSTAIRQAIADGDMIRAGQLLGRPWSVTGRVRGGDRRGRTIGFPTANIAIGRYVEPATGVYAIRAHVAAGRGAGGVALPGGRYDGVANFGRRPTFDKRDLLLEAHLFDFAGDLYGRQVEIAFIERIRAERRFDGIEALKAQIAADSERARGLLADAADRRYG
ncbi:riboflavin biosynthesis protein [Tistrella bauzanensis]|uniref:Riboflavin biosynthesis protein n=1 Tax=Tistrella bauzanensis TaxID=657419 RepID=A0ABQ1ISG7_9PROT|nr:bifunctional riboflavin kinase/FAD synthetase [Tistrella bauzanensis]GGB49371.1 riboflavin biosynthesis protein [Tistrella bauzanensis]